MWWGGVGWEKPSLPDVPFHRRGEATPFVVCGKRLYTMKLEKQISLNWKKYPVGFKLGKNPVHQTRYFKQENWKNPAQIDRGPAYFRSPCPALQAVDMSSDLVLLQLLRRCLMPFK